MFTAAAAATDDDEEDNDSVVASGTCGDDLTWTLFSDGTLTISGSGAMTSYSDDDAPWYFYRTSITSVVIKEGATSIGSNAFYGCTNLTSVDLGESVTSITIPLSVTSIGSYAFYNCTSLTYVYYAGSEETGTRFPLAPEIHTSPPQRSNAPNDNPNDNTAGPPSGGPVHFPGNVRRLTYPPC